jgi:hypothetical protein
MGWKEAINTYPSSIVYEIHDWAPLFRERAGFSVQMTWPLPAGWIGQYAACTVAVQRPEF